MLAGHTLAMDTPFDRGLHRFAELAAEKTSGRVHVDVHPNGALGSEPEQFQSMQAGTQDIGIFAPGSMAEFAPVMSLLATSFLVVDREHCDAIITGPVTTGLAADVEARTGTNPLTYFGGSYRQMFFNAPAAGLQDTAGRLFRIQPAEIIAESYSTIGREPTVVAYNELYNALQQGVIGGADNEAIFILSQNFFEPAPHILRTNHEVTIRPVMVAGATLERLGTALADLVLEAAQEAGDFERELESEEDDEALRELSARDGVTVIEAATADAIEAAAPAWRRFAQEWGVETVLDSILDVRPEG